MITKSLPMIGTSHFLRNLTGNRLTEKQLNRAGAYLRAKGISFYDDWSREHCMLLDAANANKLIVIQALKETLKN